MSNAPSEKQILELYEAASKARQSSHSPYSNFAVGAALLTTDDQVFTGCNVENASYGLCICAEQVAITKAVSSGCKDFALIVVVASPLASPCGACRQIIGEFFDDEGLITCFDSNDSKARKTWTMSELLPDRFQESDLLGES